MELSSKQWKLVFGDGVKRRRVTIEAAIASNYTRRWLRRGRDFFPGGSAGGVTELRGLLSCLRHPEPEVAKKGFHR